MVIRVQMKMYLLLTLAYVICSFITLGLLYLLTPTRWFGVYPAIEIFYWVCGMALNYLLNRYRNSNPDRLVNIYMFFRFGQFVLTIMLLVVGIYLAHYQRIAFTVSLLSNFLIFSALELYIYSWHNRRATQRKAQRARAKMALTAKLKSPR